MWGLDLRHEESTDFVPDQRTQLMAKTETILTEKGFKNIEVCAHLISATKSTPFLLSFFGGLHSTTFYNITFTNDGKLTVTSRIPKGPFTDWGFCKREVSTILNLITIN